MGFGDQFALQKVNPAMSHRVNRVISGAGSDFCFSPPKATKPPLHGNRR
jgi:hypothetical protein